LKKKLAILAGWQIYKINNIYYINNMHYIYLNHITNLFSKIYLICPVSTPVVNKFDLSKVTKISWNKDKIEIKALPPYTKHTEGIMLFKYFLVVINEVKSKVDVFYCRVPDPYAWMPKLLFQKESIMHYVGDSLEVIKTNKKFSPIKKLIYSLLYLPEYFLTLLASRFSRTYTNGIHIAQKLSKIGINAKPVISSTLTSEDFCDKKYDPGEVIYILYVGYIRYSKGVDTLIKTVDILVNKYNSPIKLFIVGEGEMKDEINKLIKNFNIEDNVMMYGHIDDRNELNRIYRKCDIFVFPSLSEGSPRVILEAMANSLPIVSTPVGSLPYVFVNNKDILFAKYDDSADFAQKIRILISNKDLGESIRYTALKKVYSNFTLDNFMNTLFEDYR